MTGTHWPDVLGYIDPGSAGVLFGILGPVIAIALGILGAILWPFRWFFANVIKRAFRRPAVLWGTVVGIPVLALAGFGGYSLMSRESGPTVMSGKAMYKRVFLLGMDGLEPKIVERMMQAGELPNFARLAAEGTYQRIATSNPPESPVAWSCIATGRNPGKHGIFDFIHIDRKKLIPYLSITLPNPKNYTGKRTNAFLNAVKADSFWIYASQSCETNVIRWPGVFPPDKVSGRFYSGLGTPDINGRPGAYTFFTTNPEVLEPSGRKNAVTIQWENNKAETALKGPTIQGLTGKHVAEVPVQLERRADGQAVVVQIAGGDPITVEMKKWTPFARLKFKLGTLQGSLPGMLKFYLDQVEPELKLYASPIHIDPLDPAYPFTQPNEFAKELAEKIGDYHTLGMPEIVHALSDGCYGPEAFLEECAAVEAEREKMLDLELDRFNEGLLAFIFDTSDRLQHMFWVTEDPEHPLYDEGFTAEYGHVIPDMYKNMDRILGKALDRIDKDTALFVLSDHGFNTFRRAVSLNTWFIQNGYLTLKDGQTHHDEALPAKQIDWSKTKAVAVGFASIYFNVKGRESEGIVEAKDIPALCEEIGRKLRDLRDPKNNEPVVRRVYATSEIYRGQEVPNAPDLIIGFEAGYRAGWQMALGGAGEEILEDNLKQWCGDHLMDHQLVPGVFFSNQKLKEMPPRLIDVAPTILTCLGVEVPADMDGESLMQPK
ncbi:MAG: alkaline phosphatase family protein [Phycisphaerae bacterium]|nr:alkaline phosphatase family protein [Phycisphaerae bacterium]